MSKKEHETLQLPAQKLLDTLGIRYIHIENNQHQQKYRKSANKKYKGFPDLGIMFKYGRYVVVEFKLPDETQSKDQLEWEDYLVQNGYRYYLITEFNKFVELVERYK